MSKIDRFKNFNSLIKENTSTPENLPQKGLIAYVYKSPLGDATAGGITSKYEKVVVVGSGIPEIFSASADMPAVFIDKIRDHIIARPAEQQPNSEGTYMFGGNFIYTSDSRFSKICEYPIPVHDRFEDWETNDRMSR